MFKRTRKPVEGPVNIGHVAANQRFRIVGTGLILKAGTDAHRCGSIGCSCDNKHGKVFCLHAMPEIHSLLGSSTDFCHFDRETLVEILSPFIETVKHKLVRIEKLKKGQKFFPNPDSSPYTLYEVVEPAHDCGVNPCNCKKHAYYKPACVHIVMPRGQQIEYHCKPGTLVLPE